MKTRFGFVSNSSSSSFAVLGIKIGKDTIADVLRRIIAAIGKDVSNFDDEELIDIFYDADNDLIFRNEEVVILGATLHYITDDGFYGDLKGEEFYPILKKVEDIVEKAGFKKEDIRLYTGTGIA